MRYSILLACLVLLLAAGSSATTYIVDPDGTGDFPTIQAAIDAAEDGDVIELTDGTFTGDGNRDIDYLGKALTVHSQSGDPATCIIDCEGTPEEHHLGFNFRSGEGPEAVVEGVTVTNGFAEIGGAVYCRWASSPTIRECIFSANSAELYGGGVACREGSLPQLSDCLFSDNSAGAEGGGMCCDNDESGPMTISSCTFRGNTSQSGWGGGGLFCGSVMELTLTGCIFEDNETVGITGGGGLFAYYCLELTVSGCDFIGNQALDAYGGGGVFCVSCGAEFTDCHFESNTTTVSPFGGGGGICAHWGPGITLSHCTFAHNITNDEGGGARFYSVDMGPVEISHCTFWGNSADAYGGAVSCRGTLLNMTTCTMYGNDAPVAGGLLCAQGSTVALANSIVSFSAHGEGIFCGAGENEIVLSCCDIYGNAGGDWVDCIADQYGISGNIAEHPLFCGPEVDDFTIAENSPCAPFTPPNPECDLIGAWPVGCGPASVPDWSPPTDEPATGITWGRLKSLFQR
jgi:hypothetical protein